MKANHPTSLMQPPQTANFLPNTLVCIFASSVPNWWRKMKQIYHSRIGDLLRSGTKDHSNSKNMSMYLGIIHSLFPEDLFSLSQILRSFVLRMVIFPHKDCQC